MQDNITTAYMRMTFAEQRKFRALVQAHRMTRSDAVRLIERDRNRAAIGHYDVRDMHREQANRRTVKVVVAVA